MKTIEPIAFIKNGYNEKFGVPRQSGLATSVMSEIHFLDKYKDENYIRGIEQYSHLWVIWGFSENENATISPTVRPPKLGGNKRIGVFATRSSFRPNGLALTVVKLNEVKSTQNGKVLVVSGGDFKNNTPVYDIKPYIPYADCVLDAVGGFAEEHKNDKVQVDFPENIKLSEEIRGEIEEILALDPKPSYKNDDERIYGLSYKNFNIKFRYEKEKIVVLEVAND